MAGVSRLGFRITRPAAALTMVLLVEAALFYTASFGENVPVIRPLSAFPAILEGWQMAQEFPVTPEVQAVLRADDTLSRAYAAPGGGGATLFVAYFKTQRTGQTPHSPKNCLPGNGFEPSAAGFLKVKVRGRSQPITINRYVVSRGEERDVVLYWYQSRQRVIASEYSAKIWLVLDSIRYHRSDTALVRVVVPVSEGNDDAATRRGAAMVRDFFPALERYLSPVA